MDGHISFLKKIIIKFTLTFEIFSTIFKIKKLAFGQN